MSTNNPLNNGSSSSNEEFLDPQHAEVIREFESRMRDGMIDILTRQMISPDILSSSGKKLNASIKLVAFREIKEKLFMEFEEESERTFLRILSLLAETGGKDTFTSAASRLSRVASRRIRWIDVSVPLAIDIMVYLVRYSGINPEFSPGTDWVTNMLDALKNKDEISSTDFLIYSFYGPGVLAGAGLPIFSRDRTIRRKFAKRLRKMARNQPPEHCSVFPVAYKKKMYFFRKSRIDDIDFLKDISGVFRLGGLRRLKALTSLLTFTAKLLYQIGFSFVTFSRMLGIIMPEDKNKPKEVSYYDRTSSCHHTN